MQNYVLVRATGHKPEATQPFMPSLPAAVAVFRYNLLY